MKLIKLYRIVFHIDYLVDLDNMVNNGGVKNNILCCYEKIELQK